MSRFLMKQIVYKTNMPLKTLGGIFDEPKKAPKKNFIRENIKALKHLESIVQEAQKVEQTKSLSRGSSPKRFPRDKTKSLSLGDLRVPKENTIPNNKDQSVNAKSIHKTLSAIDRIKNLSKSKGFKPKKTVSEKKCKPQLSDRSVQTDFDDTFLIEINSPTIIPDVLPNTKEGHSQTITPEVPLIVKGVVTLEPQYPPGHTVLPESERIETLATYKKNYDKLINELNSLPLTCDTLRIRKKRIKIEDELLKIEEAIKMFERPRVFIKK
ncbi:uncharacterized protein LOC126886849 [Diabrotica virgifera virgifera]|uniref:Uncharacterized protein LOC114344006 n=1 Tax=Diabrotica virgifera virgifera TaxID=50390 RepID=A0A6P7GYZ5_DIAVI|nr:uncharacterized protein LOC126886849 [Diabrotica virgifera virgifera]